MYKGLKIKPPFFEIGPKAFMYGEQMLALAKVIDKVAMKYDIDVIVTPQYTDIRLLAENTERIWVFAQHMDPLPIGRGLGSVLPESIKAAGATGVMLNHAEKPISLEVLAETIKRADELELGTIVCSDTAEEAAAIAALHPNMITAEPTANIGTGVPSDMDYVMSTINAIKAVDPEVMVLQGAGIKNGQDVYNVIHAGAEATGTTSGIMKSDRPYEMVEEMLYNVRKAWNEIHNIK